MNSRRAISTIVGSVFFLVLLTSGLSVSYMVIETQSDMIEAQQTIADSEIKKIQEKFDVSASTNPAQSNRLALYVQNEGSNPLEVDTVWVVNNTANDAKKFSVNYADSVLASGYGAEILQNTPLQLNPGDYDIKLVSALGTVKATKLQVDSSGGSDLQIKMMIDPPDVRVGENATAWVYVTNTGTTDILDVNVQPITVTPPSAVVSSSPVLQSSRDLAPSESAIFAWKYTVTGSISSSVTFSTYAAGMRDGITPIQSSVDQNTIKLRENLGSIQEVVSDDLFGRPQVFMIIPSPFGDSPQRGLWGVNVANPTSQPIYVNKVVVNVVSPRANSNDKIFNEVSNNCDPVTVAPTSSAWSCPAANQLMWKDTANPQIIPPKSVFPFLAMVKAGSLAGSQDDLETIIVQTNIFTTLGQFGKPGYGSSMRNGGSSMANVYLSAVSGSTSDSNIRTNMTSIRSGTAITLNATLADFDTGTTNVISSGSRLIVNIPRDWTSVNVLSSTGFSTPTLQSFPDGSSQLVGVLSSDLTGAGGTARTIKFSVTAPTVTETQMYVMYILAEGDVNNEFQLGPLTEAVLQVIP